MSSDIYFIVDHAEPLTVALVAGGGVGTTGSSTVGGAGGAGGYVTMQLYSNVQYKCTTITDVSYGVSRILTDQDLNTVIAGAMGGGIGRTGGLSPTVNNTNNIYTCVSGTTVSTTNRTGGGGGGYFYLNNYRGRSYIGQGATGRSAINATSTSSGALLTPSGFGSGGGCDISGLFHIYGPGATGVNANTIFNGIIVSKPPPENPTPVSSITNIPDNGCIIVQSTPNTFRPEYISSDVLNIENSTISPAGVDNLGRQYFILTTTGTLDYQRNTYLGQLYANVWLFNTVNGSLQINNGSFKLPSNTASATYNVTVGTTGCSINDTTVRYDLGVYISYTQGIRAYIDNIYPSRYITWNSTNSINYGIVYFIDNASTKLSNPNYTPITPVTKSFNLSRDGVIVSANVANSTTYVYILQNFTTLSNISLINGTTFTFNFTIDGFVIGNGGSGGISHLTSGGYAYGASYSGAGGGAGGINIIPTRTINVDAGNILQVSSSGTKGSSVTARFNSTDYISYGGGYGTNGYPSTSRAAAGESAPNSLFPSGQGGSGADSGGYNPNPDLATTNGPYGAAYGDYGVNGSGMGAGYGGSGGGVCGGGGGGWDPTKLIALTGTNLTVPTNSNISGGVILVLKLL